MSREMGVIIFIVILVLAIIIIPIIQRKWSDVRKKAEVYAGLCSMGLDARMVERGRIDENIVKPKGNESLGLIEIQGSPICRINMLREKQGCLFFLYEGISEYKNVYLILDSNIHKGGHLELESVRLKSVPLFGRVVDLLWRGNFDSDLYRQMMLIDEPQKQTLTAWKEELVKRLGEDALIKQTLIRLKEDIKVRSHPEYGYWAIVSEELTPSREQWDCYETIARYLLESSRK